MSNLLRKLSGKAKKFTQFVRTSSSPILIQGAKEIQHEDAREYKKGGYHPVKIGDVLDESLYNYEVVGKLGWGHFSTVWLCYDYDYKEFVACKVVKSAKQYTDAALDEIKLCTDLQGCLGNIQLLDHFNLRGTNGKHVCMVFELGGENLLSLIRKFQYRNMWMPKELVKQITRDTLIGLESMREKKLIHTDIKPENVLMSHLPNRVTELQEKYTVPVKRPKNPRKTLFKRKKHRRKNTVVQQSDSIVSKLSDFGNACWTYKQFTDDIQTRQYRCPEVILGLGYSTPSDIWSLGCLVFELITSDYLFNPRCGKTYTKDEDHLAQIIELLGPMDINHWSRGKYFDKFFKSTGELRNIKKLKYWELKSVLMEKYNVYDDVVSLSDFIQKMLHYDPKKRATPRELLHHPWLKKTKKLSKEDYYQMYKDYY